MSDNALAVLLAKEEIRELALLYCRGVDRKDYALLRTLYTRDGWDAHGAHFNGAAQEYVDFLEMSLARVRIGAHFVCNHLIAVDGDVAEGEVYALGFHQMKNDSGGMIEDFVGVRYLDQYRVEDGRWKFASRDVQFDLESRIPIPAPVVDTVDGAADKSYSVLLAHLFRRGSRV